MWFYMLATLTCQDLFLVTNLADGLQSKKVLLFQGVPQGEVISTALFLVYINDLVTDLPAGVKVALYADYLTPVH